MRYELAVRMAALLEQYVTYRTDWLAQWQRALTPALSRGGGGRLFTPSPSGRGLG